MPKPWQSVSREDLISIRGVCLDIDDTLSTRGKLTSAAYLALWQLYQAGFAVVPVTGRPAGWCDHIARFWPVHAVVGENGAFTFFMDKGVRKRINTLGSSEGDWESRTARLADLGNKIRKRFPHARWASDQAYREFDLAIDVCEDVEPWAQADVQGLLDLCRQEGAHAKLSSIHVNAWFGDFDKKKGFEAWIEKGSPGWKGAPLKKENWIYIGDSPNDEPMFKHFQFSAGVANLSKYLPSLQHPPMWITSAASGDGFAQIAQKLVAHQNYG